MTRTLAAVATQVQGRLIGADRGFGDVSTDTRTLGSGALFVAIVGERFDGNDFIAEAHSKGASGALVSRAASAVQGTCQPCGCWWSQCAGGGSPMKMLYLSVHRGSLHAQ